MKQRGYEPRIVVQHGAFIMTPLDGSLGGPKSFHESGGRLRGSSDLDSPKAETFRGKIPGGKATRSCDFAAANPGGRLHLHGFGHRSSCRRAPLAENRPIGNSPQWDDSV